MNTTSVTADSVEQVLLDAMLETWDSATPFGAASRTDRTLGKAPMNPRPPARLRAGTPNAAASAGRAAIAQRLECEPACRQAGASAPLWAG
jgi:hypothetical protein